MVGDIHSGLLHSSVTERGWLAPRDVSCMNERDFVLILANSPWLSRLKSSRGYLYDVFIVYLQDAQCGLASVDIPSGNFQVYILLLSRL